MIFSLIIIISLVLVSTMKSPGETRLKPYMIIGLLLMSIADGRVFTRQREKDKDIISFIIKFVALIALFYLLI